ncbi:DHA2 family efflux MFS transporter permease subunit [Microvirga arabica]|uniref:DHA2 family efflux MFS transporter permease subunit n=1 Tax=Microvirga arabica TaxID=1128671 RepID=UPI00193A9D28|nr:DHA2 family efflux MFS transporter permease subunit [Microvirga arabica]MBM1173867.1 DHA2 family efflux MFS transporter permease subunit [Microvirga arabica]
MPNEALPQAGKRDRGLGLSLAVIATAQLMVVLDDTIANIALPTLQNDLGISAANLPWVINAYILAFGGLLLFGGRLGDLFGRRRMLQVGMALFTIASLLVGLAQDGMGVIASRGLQGMGAALVAPNALALIATTFPEGKSRNGAMAVYGAMSGLGIIVGLILGGLLTGTLGWRWAFFINVPIGLAVLAGSGRLVEAELHKGRPDFAGAITSIGGMAALVYGITRGGEHGWTDPITLASFAASAILLPVFLVLQARSKDPLLPLRLFRDRNRAGSYLAMLLLGFGPMGMLYLLTLYMQHILGYSPIWTALAFLPFGAGIILGAVIGSKLLIRVAPREVAVPGALIGGAALFWLSGIGREFDFIWHFMPAAFLTAFGFVMAVIALALTAVKGVPPKETGIASALFNASQQVGVAFGLAVLSTISVSVTASRLPDALAVLHRGRETGDAGMVWSAGDALIHGYGLALVGSGVALVIAAVIAAVLVNARRGQVAVTGDAPLH